MCAGFRRKTHANAPVTEAFTYMDTAGKNTVLSIWRENFVTSDLSRAS
jgi:hypothetical protein